MIWRCSNSSEDYPLNYKNINILVPKSELESHIQDKMIGDVSAIDGWPFKEIVDLKKNIQKNIFELETEFYTDGRLMSHFDPGSKTIFQ